MSRRVSLPSADDLFRRTEDKPAGRGTVHAVPDHPEDEAQPGAQPSARPSARPSGRVRHDEKMTVYVTSAELLEIEHARLSLRSEHGLVIDRGRLVREAVGMVLADLQRNGEDSALVRRLTDE